MAKAKIGPTGYGTFGIRWEDFPYMQTRGGYSGPFNTQDEARERATLIAESHGETLTIEFIETVNP
ncbi:hypothetical protein LCGC14_1977600 [marine sediment metagenome]|uniref:AP2/ERF domain-containing protein n=1 Tax=marine sediment metagenome TaxID=412755 RepID=A0A0F9FA60_9ZZZZ